MKYLILITLLVPSLIAAQTPNRTNQQILANRIVAYFYGDSIFNQNIIILPASGNTYHYIFRHHKFKNNPVNISFALDSTGMVMPGKELTGLVKIHSSHTQWISGAQAIRICRDQSRRIRKRSLRLALRNDDHSETRVRYHDLTPCDLVWQVDGEVEFRGERYKGTFEVDVFNGGVTRRFAIPWD